MFPQKIFLRGHLWHLWPGSHRSPGQEPVESLWWIFEAFHNAPWKQDTQPWASHPSFSSSPGSRLGQLPFVCMTLLRNFLWLTKLKVMVLSWTYFPSKNSILAFKSSKEWPPPAQGPLGLAPDLFWPWSWCFFGSEMGAGNEKSKPGSSELPPSSLISSECRRG